MKFRKQERTDCVCVGGGDSLERPYKGNARSFTAMFLCSSVLITII